jgi:hypothetical protein
VLNLEDARNGHRQECSDRRPVSACPCLGFAVRVVTTCPYRAAGSALSQGIPVAAPTSSSYYDDKFRGLADMFGTGLQLSLDSDGLEERLVNAVRSTWEWAPRNPPVSLSESCGPDRGCRRASNGPATSCRAGTGSALVHRLDRCGDVAR